ncbi:MAG TPA: class I SAM-dependent methyltransferase [Candidatus Limnocylindrales bacterium]
MAPDRATRLAAFYDLDLRDDPGDLDLYLALADREGGPVLELGVGTGRLAVPLAAAGHAVTGVDDDAAMLARAAVRWEQARPTRHGRSRGGLELVQADLLEVDLGARFGLAFLALNSLFLMGTYERQVAAVRALARHLRPGGLALVDVWLPSADELSAYDARLALEWLRPDEDGRHHVAKLGSARLDTSAATVTLTTFFDRWATDGGLVERTARTDELRLVTAAELRAMAQAAGLGVEMLAGDYRMEPFGPGAERVLLLGRLV